VAKLPDPPDPEELRRIGADLRALPAGTLLFRIYFRGGDHPGGWDEFRRFGPLATARFDHHPDPQGMHEECGIHYAASLVKTCVAEAFQTGRAVDPRRREPWLAGFALAGEIRLLNLGGDWPTRAGGSMKINSGPRPITRRWSRAIHEAYPEVVGLLYASSMHANEEAVALYERASPTIPIRSQVHVPLSHPGLHGELDRICGELGYALLP
jgi:RES domain